MPINRQKISQMTPKGADLASTDLLEVSVQTGAGYETRSITGDEILFNSLSGYVPYTGATQDVDLDTNKISARSVYIEGTNGDGHLHLKHQSADATASGQSTALYADSNGDLKYKNDNDYYTTLKTSSNTADRVYTYPDENCTLAPREVTTVTYTAALTTLQLSDTYKLLKLNVGSANDLRIPTNLAVPFAIGTQIILVQYGTGQTTVTTSGGVTLRSSGGKTKIAAQYGMATIIKIDTNEWILAGDLTT